MITEDPFERVSAFLCSCCHTHFRREAVFVCVAGNGGDAIDSEVEWGCGEAGALEEWHYEAAETAVDWVCVRNILVFPLIPTM